MKPSGAQELGTVVGEVSGRGRRAAREEGEGREGREGRAELSPGVAALGSLTQPSRVAKACRTCGGNLPDSNTLGPYSVNAKLAKGKQRYKVFPSWAQDSTH